MNFQTGFEFQRDFQRGAELFIYNYSLFCTNIQNKNTVLLKLHN